MLAATIQYQKCLGMPEYILQKEALQQLLYFPEQKPTLNRLCLYAGCKFGCIANKCQVSGLKLMPGTMVWQFSPVYMYKCMCGRNL